MALSSPFIVCLCRELKNAVLVLIESDKEKGFAVRQDSQALKESRRESNRLLSLSFFDQPEFREKMDLIYYNPFGDTVLSAVQLLEELYAKILHEPIA